MVLYGRINDVKEIEFFFGFDMKNLKYMKTRVLGVSMGFFFFGKWNENAGINFLVGNMECVKII